MLRQASILYFLLLLTPTCFSLSVSTYNVMCVEDEYSDSWGCPIQISLCKDDREACTTERRKRQWEMMDKSSVDVFLLQEVEDGFLDLLPSQSPYALASRSGQCAILVRSSSVTVLSAFNLTIPDQTGCEYSPAVTIASSSSSSSKMILASLHAEASISDMGAFYSSISTELERWGLGRAPVIVGGDFNHNVSDASPPEGYSLSSPSTQLSNGTSQHQDNWMGSFDYFFHSSALSSSVMASTSGFMPKSVVGFTQG
eukprot:CAMPEP_0118664692 /NCGR_PEP_ID=MMETSP0785-20121206/18171_1 /TAXON_ID=91992 /ORGANISM="Bolidomonas pacifica, Strain CCMP 1866" /LENGTH=255 /DNA_ID=CAMNT_0006558661 /DNA_START=12 /DNA_END=776 /DNA_ORIENTATION=+